MPLPNKHLCVSSAFPHDGRLAPLPASSPRLTSGNKNRRQQTRQLARVVWTLFGLRRLSATPASLQIRTVCSSSLGLSNHNHHNHHPSSLRRCVLLLSSPLSLLGPSLWSFSVASLGRVSKILEGLDATPVRPLVTLSLSSSSTMMSRTELRNNSEAPRRALEISRTGLIYCESNQVSRLLRSAFDISCAAAHQHQQSPLKTTLL